MVCKKRIYISGCITGDDNYKAKFMEAQNRLSEAGYTVVLNPAASVKPCGDYATELKQALRLMLMADAVALLPDWEESRGARIEARLAGEIGLPVKPLDKWLEEFSQEITHAKLVELGREWLIRPYCTTAPYGHYGCSVVLSELSAATYGSEIPDVLGFCPRKSILIECKASLADFRADQKKPFRIAGEKALGLIRWYLAPKGLIPVEEVPEKWGLLEVLPGHLVIATKRAEPQGRGYESEMAVLLSLLRRLNIADDGHVAIRRFVITSNVNRATFFVDTEVE
jgi:hypothetical protein